MAKWVKVGGVLLALAWAPFLYKEIASEPEQPEARALPDTTQDDTSALHAAESEPEAPAAQLPPAAAAEEAHPAEPEPPSAPGEVPAAEAPTPAAAPAAVAPTAVPPAAATAQQVEHLAAAAVAPNAPHAEDDHPAVEGEEGEAEPEPTPPTASGPADALKQAYDQQPRDALWAADVEGKLSALFGNDDVPRDLLRNASCRKAVCRVELRWTTARATAYVSVYEAIQKLGGEVGVEPVGAATEQGEQQVDLYLTRKGYTLADLSR